MQDRSGVNRNTLFAILVIVLVFGGGFYFLQSQQLQSSGTTPSLTDYTTNPSSTPDFTTFTHPQQGVRIDYPNTWQVDAAASLVPAAFYSPFTSDLDSFQENVNVTTEDTTAYGEISLEDYAAAGLENIQASIPEYTLVEQGLRTFGKNAYQGAYLLGDYSVPQINLKIYSLFTLVNGKAYVLTYTYQTEEASLYQTPVDQMIATFEIVEGV